MDPVTGLALGTGVSESVQGFKAVANQILNFKSNLRTLEKRLVSVKPRITNIQKLQNSLDDPEVEADRYIKLVQDGENLVKKCRKMWYWNVYKIFVYSKKLVALDKSIVECFQIDMQGLVAENSLRTRIVVERSEVKLDLIARGLNLSVETNEFSGLGILPGVPNGVIGFDQRLKELKEMFFKVEVQIMVISGPGGRGKTTLAKMLFNDAQIQRKYEGNIHFVRVGKCDDKADMVTKILEERWPKRQLPVITNDNAIDHLERWVRKISPRPPSPILLVLDDVRRNGESVLDSLLSLLAPNDKILVTSRYAIPKFKYLYNLEILNDRDAMTLFSQCASLGDGPSTIPSHLVEKTVKGCKGLPLAIKLVARSLCGQEVVKWSSEQKNWSDGKELLEILQPSLDALEEMENSLKDCCLDLGSFPEGQRVPAITLIDIWAELYNLKDGDTSYNLVELALRNLVNLLCTRKTGNEVDVYCNKNYVMQHDLVRESIIHQGNREPIEHKKRLIIEIIGNDFPKWWAEEVGRTIHARLLSISTDKNFRSEWLPLTVPAAEVVILNCCSGLYKIPQFIESMDKLKVLVVTNNGSSLSSLPNFGCLGRLPNLRRIRLERVSLVSLITSSLNMVNLQKISFAMCDIGKAFEEVTVDLPRIFPKLMEIEIDCCDDLLKLHAGLCSVDNLKKISITYCNELTSLPKEIGRLTNLEVLRLNSCTKLIELPESIGNLHNLTVLDISDCVSLSNLPRRIGELCALKTFDMRGCQGWAEVPSSVKDMTLLENVTCDEGASHLWRPYLSDLKNLKVKEVKKDASESFRRIMLPFQHS